MTEEKKQESGPGRYRCQKYYKLEWGNTLKQGGKGERERHVNAKKSMLK